MYIALCIFLKFWQVCKLNPRYHKIRKKQKETERNRKIRKETKRNNKEPKEPKKATTTTTTTQISVFRSSSRSHATHAIGELKNTTTWLKYKDFGCVGETWRNANMRNGFSSFCLLHIAPFSIFHAICEAQISPQYVTNWLFLEHRCFNTISGCKINMFH